MKNVKTAGAIIAISLIALSIFVQPASANPGTRWDSLWAFMTENYDPINGGYSLVNSEASRIEATYPAIIIIQDMGLLDDRPPVVDFLKMKNLTQKLQWSSGGEDSERYGGLAPFIAGTPTMESTFHSYKLWELMNLNNDIPFMETVENINATSLLFWVNKSISFDGGFGVNAESAPDIVSTYQSLFLIDALIGETDWLFSDLVNETETTNWTMRCRVGDGFALSPDSLNPSVTATAAGLMALELLGNLADLGTELQTIRNWVLARQTDSSIGSVYYGGFEEGALTNDTNIRSTHSALLALGVLSATPTNISQVARFVLDCQASNGGWGNTPGIELGSMYQAALALECLTILGDEYVGMIYEEDPNNPAVALIDWRVLFVLIFVVGAAIIAIVALRME